MYQKLLRDPLIHFLLAGISIFFLVNMLGTNTDSTDRSGASKTILVDRETMLLQLQYLTKTFEPEIAAKRLNSLPEEELELLIKNYVRDEALYREAKSYGFGENDYIIKKRMIQKIDFLTEKISQYAPAISNARLEEYYQSHKQQYLDPAHITFTHIFFDKTNATQSTHEKLAHDKLIELQKNKVDFNNASYHGDRFPFGLNYAQRTFEEISSHFGKTMTQALFALTPNKNQWRGVFTSQYGSHLVLVAQHQKNRIPPFEEVKNKVFDDLQIKMRRENKALEIDKIVARYTVKRTQPLQLQTNNAPAKNK